MHPATRPEVRALLFIVALVLTSAALQTVSEAFGRLEAAHERSADAVSAVEELQQELNETKEKVDELESQLEELRDEAMARR